MQKRIKNFFKLWPWQTKPGIGTDYTQMNMEQSKSLGPILSTGMPLPALLHQSCKTLMYDLFLDIIETNDVRLLLISGTATVDELINAWESILQEYSDLIRTDKSSSIADVYKKIIHTSWKITFIEKALYLLKVGYDAQVAEQIANLGYDLIQPNEDREVYLKQIYGVETDAKFLIVLIDQYNNEYKLLTVDTPRAAMTGIDYQKELAILSKFMGHRINKKEITVYEFAGIVNFYIESAKKEKANGATL